MLPNVPARIQILDAPVAEILCDPVQGRISLRVLAETMERIPAKLPKFLVVRQILSEGNRYCEVTTTEPRIHRPFYFLLLSIVDHLAAGATAIQSLICALSECREMLRAESDLSDEALIGLFGELWVLRELIGLCGAVAVDSWTGPLNLPHDFRIEDVELEIKTTRSNERVHRIHGLRQLTPTLGSTLCLVSMIAQPTGPGSGLSIPELVDSIESVLAAAPTEKEAFRSKLAMDGYLPEDAERYSLRLVVRGDPMVIAVDERFPSITPDGIARLIGPNDLSRLTQVEYSLNVEGLGECFASASSIRRLSRDLSGGST